MKNLTNVEKPTVNSQKSDRSCRQGWYRISDYIDVKELYSRLNYSNEQVGEQKSKAA